MLFIGFIRIVVIQVEMWPDFHHFVCLQYICKCIISKGNKVTFSLVSVPQTFVGIERTITGQSFFYWQRKKIAARRADVCHTAPFKIYVSWPNPPLKRISNSPVDSQTWKPPSEWEGNIFLFPIAVLFVSLLFVNLFKSVLHTSSVVLVVNSTGLFWETRTLREQLRMEVNSEWTKVKWTPQMLIDL